MNRQYDNNLRGALFKNDQKEADTHADYNGSCEIDGQKYWISAWIDVIKNGEQKGKKYMSLKFAPKTDHESKGPASASQRAPTPPPAPPAHPGFDDDIPF